MGKKTKGMLVFKGDKRPKKKSKKSKVDRRTNHSADAGPNGRDTATTTTTTVTTTPAHPTAPPKPLAAVASAVVPTVRTGSGRITTSGTVVTGHGTKFLEELSSGDALLVNDEMRVVTMRVSNGSLNLSSAFSESLSTPTAFKYIQRPKNPGLEQQRHRQKQREEQQAVETSVYDIYGNSGNSGSVFTYREKTETGSYRVKQQRIASSSSQTTTRGDLLALRSKKTSDKYC